MPVLFNIPYNSIRRRISIAQLQRLQLLLPVSGVGYFYTRIGIPGRRDEGLHGSFVYVIRQQPNKVGQIGKQGLVDIYACYANFESPALVAHT